LHGVWGSAADDVWAVGGSGLILHRDASGWSRVPSGSDDTLLDVAGSARDDVWAVGANGSVLHFDGRAWSTRTRLMGTLTGVWVAGPSEAWISAFPGLYQFDGNAWTSAGGLAHRHLRGIHGVGGALWAAALEGLLERDGPGGWFTRGETGGNAVWT